MAGCVVSTNISIFFPFLQTLWKLMTRILSDHLALQWEVLEIFGEEAASGLPTELRLVSLRLEKLWLDWNGVLGVTLSAARSCETQLILTINDLARGQNDKQQVNTILLVFSKAFEHVPKQLLLLKLKHYGARANILSVIGNFLSARTQEVIIKAPSHHLHQSHQISLKAQS